MIDWFTVLALASNFLILVWLLKRYLYKPVLAAMAEREKLIASQLRESERKIAESQKEQAEFQNKNELFDRERAGLLMEATTVAAAERQKLLEAARKEAEELRSKLQKTLQNEFGRLAQKIGALAQREVFSIVGKTLADLSGVSLEESTANILIRRLRGMSDKQREEFTASLRGSPIPIVVRSAYELSPSQKAAIGDAVKPLFGDNMRMEFEVRPDLISGIELATNGQKISWSIKEYLNSLSESVSGMLEPKLTPTAPARKDVPHAV